MRFIKWVIGLLLAFRIFLLCAQGQDLSALFPSSGEVEGWSQLTSPRIYEGDDLYELINGGADIYLEYGFVSVISGQFTDAIRSIIQVEIYQMADDSAAFGIFSMNHSRSNPEVTAGASKIAGLDFVCFHKSGYYVSITWVTRQGEVHLAMNRFAELIGGRIPDEGELPGIVRKVMALEGVENVVYFSGNIALSNLYYIDYRDIFQVEDGLYCKYDGHEMIRMRYADPAKAAGMVENVKSELMKSKRFIDFGMAYRGYSFRDNRGRPLLLSCGGNSITISVGPPGAAIQPSVLDDFISKY
jgi:hypothetical protein